MRTPAERGFDPRPGRLPAWLCAALVVGAALLFWGPMLALVLVVCGVL
jgi:hypothetical protein